MGYRQYLYEVDKNLVEEIRKCKTEDEYISVCCKFNVDTENDYAPVRCLGKKIYEFGKYYENSNKLYEHGDSLFYSEELNEKYDDYGAIILEKSGLVCAIEWQKNRIIEIYTDLMQETSSNRFDERSQFDRMKSHISDHLRWWKPEYGDYTAYNLDENCESIVKSWLYEHTIFDLVRIYKSFDWENKCLMFAGW